MKPTQKLFRVVQQFTTTQTFNILAETAEEAETKVNEGNWNDNNLVDTDTDDREITEIREIV